MPIKIPNDLPAVKILNRGEYLRNDGNPSDNTGYPPFKYPYLESYAEKNRN